MSVTYVHHYTVEQVEQHVADAIELLGRVGLSANEHPRMLVWVAEHLAAKAGVMEQPTPIAVGIVPPGLGGRGR